jgi:SPP1 gp7 family putative phage head morphogenesis protein
VFGVPPVVLGWLVGLENSPWSQMSEARQMAYEDTLVPRMRSDEKRLTRQLLTPEERAAGLKIVHDLSKVVALAEDELRKSTIAQNNVDSWTLDERRIYTGQGPHEDEALGAHIGPVSSYRAAPDKPTQGDGANPLPGGTSDTAASVDAAAALNGAQITAAIEVLLKLGTGELSRVAAVELLVAVGIERTRAERMADDQPDVETPDPAEPLSPPEDPDEDPDVPPPDEPDDDGPDGPPEAGKSGDPRAMAWVMFDVQTKAAASGWERTIKGLLDELRGSTLAIANRTLFTGAKALDKGGARQFELELTDHLRRKAVPRLRKQVYPLVLSTGKSAVRNVAAKVGLSFNVLEPGLLNYAKEEAEFLAKVMGETTGRLVADTVQRGLADGDTIAQLRKRLQDAPAFNRQRAQLVARTETTRAWNGAQRRSLSEYSDSTGSRVTKAWLSSQDDRVREEHAELDGEEVGVDEAFSNGLMEPGEPNCRCTLTYDVTKAEE